MAVVVTGTVKDYPWGMIDGVVPWTGRSTGRPQAELWYGVHEAGPSPVLDGGSADELLPPSEVPLLVKILAASHPLSIQVHPDAALAAEGYGNQSPGSTTYSDSAEKNEMLVAMSQFQVLAGWKKPDRAAAVLASLGYPDAICQAAAEGRWVDATRAIIGSMPSGGPWDPGRVRAAIGSDHPLEASALGDLAGQYTQDPGVGVAAILQYLVLDPGEALYVPAGVPHAYLRGVGLEVMTSSDNVLRLGLTGKEIAISDAMRALRMDRRPVLLTGPGRKTTPDAPFTVMLQRGVSEQLDTGHYRVVLAIDGPARISVGANRTDLAVGQAMLIPASDPDAIVSAEAMTALVLADGSHAEPSS